MTEEKVLKKLNIVDFRHLTKEKVVKMASMLDKMDPEVAKKALEQFPDFAKTTKELLSDYKYVLDKGLESNNESVKKCYDKYNTIIDVLKKELESENLSFEERKYIIEQMKVIAEKIDKKDTENKKFVFGMTLLSTAVVAGAISVFASILGGSTQIGTDDVYKED